MSHRITYVPSGAIRTPRLLDEDSTMEAGQWLVLIGPGCESSAAEIEAFFAELWPEMEPSAAMQ